MNTDVASPEAGIERWAWLLQALSGGLLVLLAGLHMIAQHFIAQGGLRNYADVVSYLRHPILLWLEVLFLLVVTSHAALGIRSILLDLGIAGRARQAVTLVLVVVSVAAVWYGVDLTMAIVR